MLSRDTASKIYDALGPRYDWFSFYEAKAKGRAMERLELREGLRVLNVGVGTGKEHRLIQEAIGPEGRAFGVDVSRGMLELARERTGAPLCLADGGGLPFEGGRFERIYCAYTLDLIPQAEIPAWLAGFRRALKVGGRVVLVSLTEGVDLPSRGFVALWKAAYAISPVACGGCRPLELSKLARRAGFGSVEREVVVQLGVPSEIIVAW